jgi:hypothetical protein
MDGVCLQRDIENGLTQIGSTFLVPSLRYDTTLLTQGFDLSFSLFKLQLPQSVCSFTVFEICQFLYYILVKMAIEIPTIIITAPDGSQEPVIVFPFPAADDELVSLSDFFSDQKYSPVAEHSSASTPSFGMLATTS